MKISKLQKMSRFTDHTAEPKSRAAKCGTAKSTTLMITPNRLTVVSTDGSRYQTILCESNNHTFIKKKAFK